MSIQLPSDEEMIRLCSERYGWVFEGPFYKEVPEPKPAYVATKTNEAGRLKDYLLSTYIIKDHFDRDHDARREFRRQNPQIGSWLDRKSKLRGNILLVALFSMDTIKDPLRRSFPDVYEHLDAIFPGDLAQGSAVYNEMEFEKKVAYARYVDS